MFLLSIALFGVFASPGAADESDDPPHTPTTVGSAEATPLPAGRTWIRDQSRSDDFDGTYIDRAKWGDLWYPTSHRFAFRNANNITLGDGALHLTARREDHNGKRYTSAGVSSLFTVPGNSYMEVRAKMLDKRANVTSSIWTQGPLDDANVNPEIDLAESMLGRQSPRENGFLTNQFRWWLDLDNKRTKPMITDSVSAWNSGVDVTAEYHTYGLERIDNTLRFYFDGVMYKQTDVSAHNVYVTIPRAVILSIEGHAGAPVDAHLPAAFEIDYVHTYIAESPAVFSGVYALVNAKSDRVLTVPNATTAAAQLIQNGDNAPDQKGQRWILEPQPDGTYKIRSSDSGQVVSIAGDDSSAPITQAPDVNADGQRWQIVPAADGRVKILNVASRGVLAADHGRTADGVGMVQADAGRLASDHADEWQIVR